MPTGLLCNRASNARRKRAVTRNDDAAWLRRMLENVVTPAVSLHPTLSLEPGHDSIAICVWLAQSGFFKCANIGALREINQ
jgi:hypothetical protein